MHQTEGKSHDFIEVLVQSVFTQPHCMEWELYCSLVAACGSVHDIALKAE